MKSVPIALRILTVLKRNNQIVYTNFLLKNSWFSWSLFERSLPTLNASSGTKDFSTGVTGICIQHIDSLTKFQNLRRDLSFCPDVPLVFKPRWLKQLQVPIPPSVLFTLDKVYPLMSHLLEYNPRILANVKTLLVSMEKYIGSLLPIITPASSTVKLNAVKLRQLNGYNVGCYKTNLFVATSTSFSIKETSFGLILTSRMYLLAIIMRFILQVQTRLIKMIPSNGLIALSVIMSAPYSQALIWISSSGRMLSFITCVFQTLLLLMDKNYLVSFKLLVRKKTLLTLEPSAILSGSILLAK